jgi:hypothetical protein
VLFGNIIATGAYPFLSFIKCLVSFVGPFLVALTTGVVAFHKEGKQRRLSVWICVLVGTIFAILWSSPAILFLL